MNVLRVVSVALAALALSACKIEIEMPEKGGTVRSENYVAEAGETVVIDVTDTSFDQTFVVEPAPGYEFVGWRRAKNHFCGNSTAPCSLATTQGFEEGLTAAILASDRVFFIAPQFQCAVDESGQRPETCDSVEKTISGQVTDGPIANATVTITVGTQTIQVQADANGFYSVEVSTTQLDALVKIEATGTSASGQDVEFVSLVGSFENLDLGEEQDVTNVTTASFVLTVDANGGEEPATLGELQAAESSVDGDAVVELAAVIKLIVDDPTYDLPEGFDGLLEFVSDDSAVDEFIAEVEAGDEGAVDETEDEIINDDTLVEEIVEGSLPPRYYVVPTANPGYLARQGSILEFDTGSRFTFSYTFDASGRGTQGNVLTGVVEGVLQDDGDTIVITDLVSASIAGNPFTISNPGIRANNANDDPVMSLSGNTLDFWICPAGFTGEFRGGGDCSFGADGGFLVSTAFELVDEVGGTSLAGNPGLSDEFADGDPRYRDFDVAVNGSNWSATAQMENNTGRQLSYDSSVGTSTNQSFTWELADGRLVLTYDQPVVRTNFPVVSTDIATQEQVDLLTNAGLIQVQQYISTTQVVYTLVNDGALVDLMSFEETTELSYDPIDLGDQVVQLAGGSELSTGTTTFRSSDNVETTPFVATCGGNNGAVCVPGTWGASFRYTPGPGFGGEFPVGDWADVVTFASDGTATSFLTGAAASWRVTDSGKLVIEYNDGWIQTVTILDERGSEYGVLKEFSNGGERFADYSFYVKADTPLVFTESFLPNAPGKYWSGEVNNWIPGALESNGQPTVPNTFGWSFGFDDFGGFGFNEFAVEPGPELVQSFVGWEVEDNILYIDRGEGVFRLWLPISATVVGGARQIYVVELQYFEDLMAIPPRINIQLERERRDDYVNSFVDP